MDKEISKGLKNLFLFHYIIGGFFGLVYLIIPATYEKLFLWPMIDEFPYRLIGAALCGFATSSWLAYRNRIWESVKLIILSEIVWCVLGAAVMTYAMLIQGYPAIGWLNTVLFAFFAIAFGLFYTREK